MILLNIDTTVDFMKSLQKEICSNTLNIDPSATITEDSWQRPEGGGGVSCVIRNGAVFDQAGVNFSHVFGNSLPPSATANRPEIAGYKFQATGISVVIHPINPFAPTSHFNVRLFVATKEGFDPVWWFGGGFDLTPYYGFEEDAIHFHNMAKLACDPFGANLYEEFKAQADDYFYLKHRKEPRGVGGIFFDDFSLNGNFEESLNFIKSVASHFSKAYFPIVSKRKDTPYSEQQKAFQLYRRGRYVEFNLIYDRGTLFGLQSGGRTESILMSLPPTVHWAYNWEPEKGSKEAELYDKFLVVKDWATAEYCCS